MTLVEVVAAIVILGTVLVGIVLAKARHSRQLARTQQQQVALRAADELLSGWWISPQGVPVEARGQLVTQPAMVWETRLAPHADVQRLGARLVQLQIRLQPGLKTAAVDAESDQPLLNVELVLPDPAFEASRRAQKQERPRQQQAGRQRLQRTSGGGGRE